MRRIRSVGCCARATSGHAAAPPKAPRNSRRLTVTPRGTNSIVTVKTRPVKGRPDVRLGQMQTYAVQQVMSALPPIATAKPYSRKWSCLLYPRKQTCVVQLEMSALGQKRTWAYASACARPSSALGRQCADVNVKNHLVLAPDAANSMLLANVGFAAVQKPTFYRKRAQVAEGFAKSCRDETAKQMFQRVPGRWRELA